MAKGTAQEEAIVADTYEDTRAHMPKTREDAYVAGAELAARRDDQLWGLQAKAWLVAAGVVLLTVLAIVVLGTA